MTNGGKKFCTHKFKELLGNSDIMHQTTCPFTLEQNEWQRDSIDISLKLQEHYYK